MRGLGRSGRCVSWLRAGREGGLVVALVLAATLGGGCVRAVGARGDGWWSIRTAHVHLETDVGRDEGERQARRVEDLHRALVGSFYRCTEHDADVVEVTVLASDAEHRSLFPNAPAVSLGASEGLLAMPRRIVASAAALEDVRGRQILAHELAHGLVEACLPDAPIWVHEGLASVFETVVLAREDVAVLGYPSGRAGATPFFESAFEREGMIVSVVPRVMLPSATELVHLAPSEFHRPDAHMRDATLEELRAANYVGATELVYLLALGPDPELRARFVAYLERLRVGHDAADAFAQSFAGVDLDAALADFLDHPEHHVHERWLPVSRPVEFASARLSAPEAQLALAEITARAHRGTTREVRAHLARAMHDPRVRARALLLSASIDPLLREARVEEASALAPDDLDVLRARGLLALHAVDRDAMAAVSEAMEARTDLRTADEIVLADLERMQGALDVAEARLVRVLRRDRSRLGAWLVLGQIAVSRGDAPTARRIAGVMHRIAPHHETEEVRAAMDDLEASLPPGL